MAYTYTYTRLYIAFVRTLCVTPFFLLLLLLFGKLITFPCFFSYFSLRFLFFFIPVSINFPLNLKSSFLQLDSDSACSYRVFSVHRIMIATVAVVRSLIDFLSELVHTVHTDDTVDAPDAPDATDVAYAAAYIDFVAAAVVAAFVGKFPRVPVSERNLNFIKPHSY